MVDILDNFHSKGRFVDSLNMCELVLADLIKINNLGELEISGAILLNFLALGVNRVSELL